MEQFIIDLVRKGGDLKSEHKMYGSSSEDYAFLMFQYRIEQKLNTLIKLDLYKLTNDALKSRLKDDFGVEDEVIKGLKNKKELVDKIIEVM